MTPSKAFATLFVVLSISGPATAQGLADFARSERNRRAAAGPAHGIITNETLAAKGLLTTKEPDDESKPKLESSPTATAKASGNAEPKDAEPKKEERGEQWWRAQFATARENVSRTEAEAQAAETQLKKANTEFLIRSDIYNKEGQLGPKLPTLAADVASAKKRAEEARTKFAELENELRRSGGLPGWAR